MKKLTFMMLALMLASMSLRAPSKIRRARSLKPEIRETFADAESYMALHHHSLPKGMNPLLATTRHSNPPTITSRGIQIYKALPLPHGAGTPKTHPLKRGTPSSPFASSEESSSDTSSSPAARMPLHHARELPADFDPATIPAPKQSQKRLPKSIARKSAQLTRLPQRRPLRTLDKHELDRIKTNNSGRAVLQPEWKKEGAIETFTYKNPME